MSAQKKEESKAPTREYVTHLLLRYLAMRKKIKTAEGQCAEIYSEIKKIEADGNLHYDETKVFADVVTDKRRVAWKVEYINRLGEEEAAKVANADRETYVRIHVGEVVEGKKQKPQFPTEKRKYPNLRAV